MAAFAGITPDFATPAASAAGRAYRHFERNGRTSTSLMARESDLGAHAIAPDFRFDKRVTHPLDLVAHGGKVDRHFICQRAIDLPVGGRRSLDSNPGIVNAPVILHSLLRSVGARGVVVNSK